MITLDLFNKSCSCRFLFFPTRARLSTPYQTTSITFIHTFFPPNLKLSHIFLVKLVRVTGHVFFHEVILSPGHPGMELVMEWLRQPLGRLIQPFPYSLGLCFLSGGGWTMVFSKKEWTMEWVDCFPFLNSVPGNVFQWRAGRTSGYLCLDLFSW